MANLFDLKKSAAPRKKSSGTKPKTDESKLLENYVEVPKSDVFSLPIKSHVRYRKNDGELIRGGYVTKVFTCKKDGPNHGDVYIELRPGLKSYKGWVVNVDKNVKTLYRKDKVDQVHHTHTESSGSPSDINFLKNQVNQLTVEVTRIATEQKRIVALIRKLHNIQIHSDNN